MSVITGHFYVSSLCISIYLQLNVIQQASLYVLTRLSVLIFASAVRPTIAEGSEEKKCNTTGKTASAVLCGNWHC